MTTPQSGATAPTFIHFQLPGDFRLAVNSNKKMKTVLVVVSFVGNLDETVTSRALLPMILRRGTRNYPDMLAVNRHLEELYGAAVTGSVAKIGEWQLVRFRMDVVNDRFLPGEVRLLREALEFLRELLWEPFMVDRGFHPEFLQQEKNNLKLAIQTLIDHKDEYASQRLTEEMCRDEPYRIYEQGRLEDLPEIGAESLRRFHAGWVETHPLHVYVAGDVDIGATRELFESVFSPAAAPRRGGYSLHGIPAPVEVGAVREVQERLDLHQARLHLGFRHGITYASPRYEALLLMNGVLGAGGFPRSKLFQNVREKANLAYSVHSSLERTKGLLFISSGIAPEKYEKALRIMLEQVKAIQDGEIADEEILAARATILNSNEMLEDDLRALADVDLAWRLHGGEYDFAGFRDRVRAVTRDEIIEAARCLKHDTTYLLTSP